jgi:hypothetical protein
MTHTSVRAGALALLTVIAVACGSGAPTPAPPSAASSPPPATFGDYDAALCGAFTSMIRAYGNPDTNSASVMRKTLEDAIAAGDKAAAERASTAMLNELEAGRRLAATAARWQPGAATAVSLDRLLQAFEAWTSAKLALTANPSAIDPQKAFERAGGVEAWTATLQGVGTTPVPSGASPLPCRAFSGEI